MVEATRRWKALTGRQRAVLRLAYQAAVAALPPDVPDGTEVELPALPPNVHPATRRALVAKGLAAGGQLTVLAVEILANAVDALAVDTAATTGEQL